MNIINDIRDIFSIFHDAGIIDCQGNRTKLTITIECQYLAELINENYVNFYIDLIDITKLDFVPWMNPIDLKPIIFKNESEFLKANMDILSSDIIDEYVKVTCSQHNTDLNYCGGDLMIAANKIVVYNHAKNPITIDELDSVCRNYWDKFIKGE